jgi:hypothetical protein
LSLLANFLKRPSSLPISGRAAPANPRLASRDWLRIVDPGLPGEGLAPVFPSVVTVSLRFFHGRADGGSQSVGEVGLAADRESW